MRTSSILLLALLATLVGCDAAPPGRATRGLSGADAGCGQVPTQGCCAGHTLVYCTGSAVATKPCAPQLCGWNPSFGLYGCGGTSGADPSGVYPRNCATDLGFPGPDAVPPADGQGAESGVGCGPLGFVGCCQGDKLHFCSGNQVLTLDCSGQLSCGWNKSGGYYDCNTAGAPDPSGLHPMICTAVLGDAGVQLDGGSAPDTGPDLTPADLGSDATDAAPADSFVLHDAPAGEAPRDLGDDAVGLDVVGLDASGLDASDRDGSSLRPGGGGGCSGCAVGREHVPPGALVLWALVGLALWRRR